MGVGSLLGVVRIFCAERNSRPCHFCDDTTHGAIPRAIIRCMDGIITTNFDASASSFDIIPLSSLQTEIIRHSVVVVVLNN
jgi:hypothetical protein